MRGFIAIALILALIGCQSAAEKAEAEYKIVRKHGSNAEQCELAHKVKHAFLEEGNSKKYEEWKSNATMPCLRASVGG